MHAALLWTCLDYPTARVRHGITAIARVLASVRAKQALHAVVARLTAVRFGWGFGRV